ncbi:glycosyltransferase family 61 protein [Dongia deserti]|uniref:glycosyltransferase family 61 protein n=1 Tax=Dongia deserti TaxID=2268030 RepID=UPI000E64C02B|nr:glycosyltransferase family 61 protein [Dongia deserti]
MAAPTHIATTEPRCVTLRDAIATPFALASPDQARDQPSPPTGVKGHTLGCLYEAGGARVDLSIGQTSIDPAVLPPEQRGGSWLNGRTLYLGLIMDHYGRFITESLSRYWLKDAGPFDHFVAYPFDDETGNIHMQDFHRYLAGLLDVPLDRMTMLRSQTVFDEIVVPEQLWVYDRHVNAHMRAVYERIRSRHTGNKSSGRIFLSRAPSERLGNPFAVEDVFAGFGFRIVYPEHMPMAEQLSLFANCEVLAGLSSSFMHNCLFARPGLLTIEVGDKRARRTPPLMQRMANELAQVEAHFIPFGEGTEANIKPKTVRKHLRTILGELERRGPVLLLRLKRALGRSKAGDKSRQQAS